MFLASLTKGNGSAEVGEIVVVSLCFASCRLVTTAATAVVVYIRNSASDVWQCRAHKLDPCSRVSRDASCRLVLVCASAVGKNREILKILKTQLS